MGLRLRRPGRAQATLASLPVRPRRLLIVVAHAVLFALAYALSYALRFDLNIPPSEYRLFLTALPWVVAVQLAALAVFRLYGGLWRYVGVDDVFDLTKATLIATAVGALGIELVLGPAFPRSVIILDCLLSLGFAGGVRILARILRERSDANGAAATNGHRRSVVIAGAGALAEGLLREVTRGTLPYHVVGLVDADPRLLGRRVHGVPVLGCLEDLPLVTATTGADLVLIASSDPADKQRVAHACRLLGVEVKGVPAFQDLLRGRAFIEQLRDIELDGLLERPTNGSLTDPVRRDLRNRRVLVSGAAGSIGAELARQIVACEPALLVLIDRNESELYYNAVELGERHPSIHIESRVGDITDEAFVRRVMRRFAPEIVYHAAAYKHVPLMEAQPIEAIKNNIFGTEIVALAAAEAGVRRFVNISTDKAVHPVSVMGMTKRASEWVVASLAGGGTTFVSVRFGNVLGSQGSVLPLFRRQVARGSPVTITDPDATRYFMVVSEAVDLVLQAGRIGTDGEVYVLDMGDPIRIGDLASNLIRRAGLEPEIDVPIEIVGLRPGERLHERAGIGSDEQASPSENEHILVVRGQTPDPAEFRGRLNDLRERVIAGDADGAKAVLRELVRIAERRDDPSETLDVAASAADDA